MNRLVLGYDVRMRWVDKEFHEITAREMYAILALRQDVFVVEQACLFQDIDGADLQCRHLWAEATGGDQRENPPGGSPRESPRERLPVVLAYLRIVPAGLQGP